MPFSPSIEFIAFDLEATGLSSSFHRIVEIGAIRFKQDGTELARLEQLVNPLCRIPSDGVLKVSRTGLRLILGS